jgi:hypothetical protein
MRRWKSSTLDMMQGNSTEKESSSLLGDKRLMKLIGGIGAVAEVKDHGHFASSLAFRAVGAVEGQYFLKTGS